MEVVYQWVILSLLAFGFLFFIIPNALYLRRSQPSISLPDPLPKISVLIPARDEEMNIGHLLTTLIQETYPHLEILVLDDESTDKTAEIIHGFTAKDSRIRYIKGETPPPGWVGKNYAASRLAEEATGDYLLFTDADTSVTPGLLELSLKQALANKADLVTGFPRLWSPSFWGKLIIPNVYFIFWGFCPFFLSPSNKFPIVAMGVGCYLFFKRQAYEKIGGHKAVCNDLTEDMALARRIKEKGLRLHTVDMASHIASKMYSSLNEVWEGYGKNLFKALGSSHIILFLFEIGFFVLFVTPFYFLFHYWLLNPNPPLLLICMTQVGFVLMIRLLISVRYQQSWQSVLLSPLSTALMLLIGLRSGLLSLKHQGYEWKGRKYD